MIPLKYKRTVRILILFLLIPALLAGCSLRTGLAAARMGAALQQQSITGMAGILQSNIDGDGPQTGILSQFQSDWDKNGKSYWEVTSEFQALGLRIPQSAQIYGSQSDKGKEYYLHLDKPGLWARIPGNQKLEAMGNPAPGLLLLLAEQAGARATLQEDQNIEQEICRLEFAFSGDEVMELLRQGGISIPRQLIHQNFGSVQIPVSISISEETWLPKALSLSLRGLEGEEAGAVLEACGIHTSGEVEQITLDLDISEFHYDEKTIPGLPQGAVERAVDLDALRKAMKKLFP